MSIQLKSPVSSLYIFSGALFFLWMSVTPLPAEELPEETKATLQMLIDAHAARNEQTSGKGIALLNRNEEGYPKIIEFMFKDKWTRRDIYSVINGNKDQRETIWVKGPNGLIHYEQSESIALIDETYRYWRPPVNINTKFKLDLAHAYLGISPLSWFRVFEELIENGYDPSQTAFSIMIDEKGMLYVTHDYWHDAEHPYRVFSFDTTNDYLLTRITQFLAPADRPEYIFSRFTDLEWSKIQSYTYISSAKSITYKGMYETKEEASSANAKTAGIRELTMLEYDPLAEIKDSEFELEGLHLPENTLVRNGRTGEEYIMQNDIMP